DRERDVDRVAFVVEFDVEIRDASVREPAVCVEGFDALQIGVETIAVEEITLSGPWNTDAKHGHPRLLTRPKATPQRRGIDGVNADERQRPDGNRPVVLTRARRHCEDDKDTREQATTHGV